MLRAIFVGAGAVAVGTAAGQGVVLLVTPWLARHYSPAEFGSLALLLTVSNIATAVACARYDMALPSAPEGEAHTLFRVALGAALVSALLLMVVLGIAGFMSSAVWPPPFGSAWMVGLCVFFVGMQQAVIGASTRERRYTTVAAIRFSQGGGFAALAALPGVGLLMAHVLSFAVSLPGAVRYMMGARVTVQDTVRSAYKRRDFPLLSLPGAVLDVIGYSSCVWIVVYFFGTHEAGQYSQIQRIVGAPLMLLGMSIGQVLLRTSADARSERDGVARLFRQLCGLVAVLGLSLVAAAGLVGEPVLRWLVGTQWRVDTAFIVPITIAVTVRACVSPLSMLLITMNRFDLALRWQVTYFVSSIMVLTTAAANLDLGNFVLVYALHELLLYGFYLMFIAKAVRSLPCAASSA